MAEAKDRNSIDNAPARVIAESARAIAECVLDLERALADILDSQPGNQSAAAERARLQLVLKAVTDFLRDVSGYTRALKRAAGRTAEQAAAARIHRMISGRLRRLAVAIEDPTRDPLFTQDATKHNAKWVGSARAHVATGICALRKAGLSRPHAAKRAAAFKSGVLGELVAFTREKRTKKFPAGSRPTSDKILDWVSDLEKGERGKIKDRAALAIFDDGRRVIEMIPRDDRKRLHAVADRMFALAARMRIPVHRGQSFRRIADSVPVIADSC
jgi:hypothetical protein